jgi:hypothetical protein
MKKKKALNINSIEKSIVEWVNSEVQKKLFFHRSMEKIESFLRDEYDNAGLLAGNFDRLSTWYFNSGISSVINGVNAGFKEILLSAIYNYWYIIITYNFNVKIIKKPTLVLNDTGLSLSRLIALGLIDYSSELSKVLIEGLNNGFFVGLSNDTVASYILQLFCKWKKIDLAKILSCSLKTNQVYKEIINNFRSENNEIFEKNLIDACNFHMMRSNYDTNKEYYEFSVERYMIYPVEILAALMIREKQGLINPNVAHQLMDRPLGKLHFFNEIPSVPMVEEVLKKPVIRNLL